MRRSREAVERWKALHMSGDARLNVFESDGTVWFGKTDSPGCTCTARACIDFHKPLIYNPAIVELAAWIRAKQITILNIAGNRKRTNPGVVEQVRSILKPALEILRG